MSKLRITQVRSSIGRSPSQRATLIALGLKKMNKTVVIVDNPCVRGMVRAVHHLVTCQEVSE